MRRATSGRRSHCAECQIVTTALPIASLYYRAWGETVAEFAAVYRSLV